LEDPIRIGWPLSLSDWVELCWSTMLYGSRLVVGGLQQVAAHHQLAVSRTDPARLSAKAKCLYFNNLQNDNSSGHFRIRRFSISERQLSSAVVSLGMDRRRIDCGTYSVLNFSTEGFHCGRKGIREIAKQEIRRSLRSQTP
jgi:hypothetical protein